MRVPKLRSVTQKTHRVRTIVTTGATLIGSLFASPVSHAADATPATSAAATAPATASATPSVAGVTPSKTPAKQPKALGLTVERFTLPNGLRVVLQQDTTSPTVAVCVTYDVGSRNEVQGRSGFAHLFEHMMFQGSRNVPKGEHFNLIQGRGGSLNGTTSADRTNYFESLPSSALATALWLEADRMKSLAVTQENFENQRAVVQEEYRMRVSNAAYAQGGLELRHLAFQGYWPHEHDTIGSMQDLDDAKLPWIREFHRAYYAPNNAVLAIAGSFDREPTVALITKYFSDAKRAQIPAYNPPSSVPSQNAERRAEVTDSNIKTPGLFYGWVIPQNRTAEHYALELATLILGHGESSVLHQRLVRETALARDVSVGTHDHRGPDLLELRTHLSEGADLAKLEGVLDSELQKLGQRGPSAAQLERAKQQLQSMFLFGMESNQERAVLLGSFETFYGDAGLLNQELLRYFEVTEEQIRAAVSRYLTSARRTSIVIRPLTQTASAPDAAAASSAASPQSAASTPAAKVAVPKATAPKGDKP